MVCSPGRAVIPRSLARLVAESARLEPLECRLADGGIVELAHDQAVEPVDFPLATEWDETDLLDVPRLEADRGAGEQVQVHAVRLLAVEHEGAVYFEEVEVRANLHRPVP